jgi:tetratricopeptide (TPR) repeat protein
MLRQALEIRKQSVGENHPDYAQSLNNLGELYLEMGLYSKAEENLRQALEILKRALGESHPSYAEALTATAALYRSASSAEFVGGYGLW